MRLLRGILQGQGLDDLAVAEAAVVGRDLFVQAHVDALGGTGGGIDQVLEEEGVPRLPGAHCYQFFAGASRFDQLTATEPGTFYLTDFLARHFERFVIRPLKLDVHPQLRESYFGNYRRLVYLSQQQDDALLGAARQAAERLGLDFEHIHCGFGELESGLANFVAAASDG